MSFQPVIPSNSNSQNLGQLNNMIRQLNKEQTVKTFRQPGGNAIITGKLPTGRYGQIYYDETGTARILIGQSPDDGRIGIWVSKEGQDVLSLLT